MLCLEFQVYTDPLADVRESKLDTSKIWCLSDLALFNFTIRYQTAKSNNAADALSRHQKNSNSSNEKNSEIHEAEVISYSTVCEMVNSYPQIV